MTEELLDQIRAAEAEAARIRADALSKAREIVKSAEADCLVRERDAAVEIRRGARLIVETMRAGVQGEIRALDDRRSFERDAMREIARARVNAAASAVAEEILRDGR